MTETAVGTDLLEALEILTELRVNTVGEELSGLAVGNIALPVEEPLGDLVLGRVLEDGDNTLELFGGELTSTVATKISLLLLIDFSPPLLCFPILEGGGLVRTACSSRHRPSCRPSWSIGDRHP